MLTIITFVITITATPTLDQLVHKSATATAYDEKLLDECEMVLISIAVAHHNDKEEVKIIEGCLKKDDYAWKWYKKMCKKYGVPTPVNK